MRWVGTRLLMHIFTETITSDESWAVSWERRRSQCIQPYSFPNILLDGWEGLKAYTFGKRQSKGVHFERNFPPRYARRKSFTFFSRRASRGAARPLHFKFASYAYELSKFSIACSCHIFNSRNSLSWDSNKPFYTL